MLEGIRMCFYKAIVQSMFKHVASENSPLVLVLQSYSQIFILLNVFGPLKTAKQVLFPVKKSMNYETLQIRTESGIFLSSQWHKKVKISLSPTLPPPPPPIFCRHSLKLLSPTLPILMNWILLSPPSLSTDPDTPQNLERAPGVFPFSYLDDEIWNICRNPHAVN